MENINFAGVTDKYGENLRVLSLMVNELNVDCFSGCYQFSSLKNMEYYSIVFV